MKKQSSTALRRNTIATASVLAVAAALSAMSPFARAAQDDDTPDGQYARGRILVIPREGVTTDNFENAIRPHHGKRRKMGQSNIHIVDIDAGSEKAAVAELRKNPAFKAVELDRKVKLAAVPNDPYYGSEWHLAKVGAAAAWDKAQGAGITIAIIDSGVDITHPDLAPHVVPGWNVYGNNADTTDVCGHGTAVAGTAAAAMNNGAGVAGVAGQAKIMPLRIAFLDGGSCVAYLSDMATAVTYAADHGARIANLSFSGVPSSAAVQNAANYLRSKGGLVFAAAGNGNRDEGYAPTSTMVIVSATDSADNRSSFSSYGNYVTLSAPGTGIYTTSVGGAYGSWSGTSFASPLAAGVAALMMSANPSLDPSKVESLLYSSATDLGTAGRDIYFGYGRVNAAAAVTAALGSTPPVDTTAPTVGITAPTGSSTVSGTTTVNVTAADNVGVSRVDLKVNNTVIASDTSAPYSFSWDTKGVANGMAALIAVAYDAAGNQASSGTVSVNVANAQSAPVKDTVKPSVAIINPIAGRVSGSVNVKVEASDNSGPAGLTLQLFVDNDRRATATGSGNSMSYTWNTKSISSGKHTLRAVAKDAAGNSATFSVEVRK
jgi:subtilisin family serine protease